MRVARNAKAPGTQCQRHRADGGGRAVDVGGGGRGSGAQMMAVRFFWVSASRALGPRQGVAAREKIDRK